MIQRDQSVTSSERERRTFERATWYVILLLLQPLLADIGAAEPVKSLTIEQACVAVTGHDVNRPDPFPGRGKFCWPGNIQRRAGDYASE